MVSGSSTRTPSSSPPLRMISKNRDSSLAVVMMFAAGMTAVRKRASPDHSTMVSSGTPSARVSSSDAGGSSGGPVT